jgi:MerR family transcriptional regulator/heat shock protein HspR
MDDRPRYMISIAAELVGMHPQTLRIYEQRGLIEPQRSPKGTRLYSQEDVTRLRRIQALTSDLGMNLAGVERVFELEGELEQMRRRMERMERRAEQMRKQFEDEVDRVRRSFRHELVPYQPPERALMPRQADAVRIKVRRPGA